MFKDPNDYSQSLIDQAAGDVDEALVLLRQAKVVYPRVPVNFWNAVEEDLESRRDQPL